MTQQEWWQFCPWADPITAPTHKKILLLLPNGSAIEHFFHYDEDKKKASEEGIKWVSMP